MSASGKPGRTVLAVAGVTAAALVAAVGLNAGLGAHPAGAVGAPADTAFVANTVTRSAVGTYQILLPGLATATVTAYGRAATHCTVGSWAASGTGTAVNVLRHSASGGLADSLFALSYLTNL